MAKKLSHIKGMSKSNLKSFRQFYLIYSQIRQTLSGEFKLIAQKIQIPSGQSLCVPAEKLLRTCSFTHFIELIKIDDELKRTFYEVETIKGNWSVRELKRQIESLLYATAGLDENLFVSKYKIVLPTTKELEDLVKENLEDLNK